MLAKPGSYWLNERFSTTLSSDAAVTRSFGVRPRAPRGRVGAAVEKRVFAKLPFSGEAGLQRPAPSPQKLRAIELVNATGTMTITVVPRPGAVWISNLPPISEAL